MPPRGDHDGGWGLRIVAALANRWGVSRNALTTVWFEIDRPQRHARLEAELVAAQ